MILALAGEAVCAVEIAGMGDVQAQRLYNVARALLEGARHLRECIRCKQLFGSYQGLYVLDAVQYVLLFYVFAAGVFFGYGLHYFLRAVVLIHGDYVVCHLIHHVYGAGAGVQHYVVTVELVMMNHYCLSY